MVQFNHATERQPEVIKAELEYIEHLAACGIRAARPHRSLSGSYVENVPTSMGVFHGVLFEALSGERMELNMLSAEALELWGRALGEMHNASQGVEIRGRSGYEDHIAMAKRIIPRREKGAWEELEAIEKTLHGQPACRDNFGLIHYDFEPDNILWDEGKIGIFDFDNCAYYWFVADIAYALRELFDDLVERVSFDDERFLAFLKGYRSMKRLEDKDLRCVPLLLRLHNLIAFARDSCAITESPLENEPKWTTDLRQRLSKQLDQYREGFRDYPIRGSL